MLQIKKVWAAFCLATLVVVWYYLRERTLKTEIEEVHIENAAAIDFGEKDPENKSSNGYLNELANRLGLRMFTENWKQRTVIEENPENHADFLYTRKTTCNSEDGTVQKCSCPDFSLYAVAEGVSNKDFSGKHGKRGNCPAHKKVMDIKTFKTGSSTFLTILYRYALVHDKNILLLGKWYKTKKDSLFQDINELTVDRLLGHRGKRNYDVFGEHVFYKPNFFAKYFPKQDSFYMTTIREPFKRLESHLQTHCGRMGIHSDVVLNLHQKDNLSMAAQLMAFIKQNTSYMKDLIDGPKFNYYTARNQQLRQLGLPHDKQDDIKFIQEFVTQLNFDLIIVTEYYDEGLVLLKRKLCWSLTDILYYKHRDRNSQDSKSEQVLQLEEKRRKIYQQWSKADYVLYQTANRTFWDQYSLYEDIQEETNHFKEVRERVNDFCESNLLKSQKKYKPSWGVLNYNETLTIEGTKWNNEFKVDVLFCILLRVDDNVYRRIMKLHQHPEICQRKPKNVSLSNIYCTRCSRCCRFPDTDVILSPSEIPVM